MKRLLSLAASAAMIAAPMSVAAQTASADPALSAFQKVCWSGGGDYMATLKAAQDDGWTDTAVTGEDAGPVSITDKAAKAKFANGANLTLLVSRGLQHTKTGDVKVATCKLTISKADAGLIGEGKAWIGVAPDAAPDPTLAVYYVKLSPGGAPSHVSQSELGNALKSGGFAVLKFQQDADAGILVYTAYSQ